MTTGRGLILLMNEGNRRAGRDLRFNKMMRGGLVGGVGQVFVSASRLHEPVLRFMTFPHLVPPHGSIACFTAAGRFSASWIAAALVGMMLATVASGSGSIYDHRFYLGSFTDRLFWGGGRDHRRGRAWPDMAPERFHHYALVQRTAETDGGTLEIYQNGQLLETVSYRGTTASDPARLLRIGRGGGQLTHPCLSVIDDVALFNRALSATEVAAIARAGSVGALLAAEAKP